MGVFEFILIKAVVLVIGAIIYGAWRGWNGRK
jgi:hypothetical protein